MIGISKLYCGTAEESDVLRYGQASGKLPSHLLQFSQDKKPVVVFNCTRACNLTCVHCYSHSDHRRSDDELTTAEAKALLQSIADFGSPVILFSGGEPLTRHDIFDLMEHASQLGLRVVLSTNGTLLTKSTAQRLKDLQLSYVGVSIDGLREVNNAFRGSHGAFDRAMQGIDHCLSIGLKVGLRFTISKRNVREIPGVFALLMERDIPRVCFYHLVYAGRGSSLIHEDLSRDETRHVVDALITTTAQIHAEGHPREVLTVDNHADGVYLYLRMLREGHPRAAEVLRLLRYNGGNSSGVGIACVSWNGDVHPDQFWRHGVLGNVKRKPFGDIWSDTSSNDFFARLKNKSRHVTGRCSACRWIDICGGNFRVRAEAVTGDVWAPDPACYLTDHEIGSHDDHHAEATATAENE